MEIFIIIVFGALVILLTSGLWIVVAAALVGVGVFWYSTGFEAMLMAVKWQFWYAVANSTFSAIPLFIFMGFVLLESGLAARIYGGLEPLLGRLPGGLLHTNIVVGALFASASGSSIAAATTIGAISLPEMEKRGYPFGVSVGSVGAGGILAPLIPPSVMMILYCMVVEESIGKQFMAGIVPGIMLAGMFMAYIALRFSVFAGKARTKTEQISLWEAILKTREIWLIVILIVMVLGSIYGGLATAGEAAAMGSVGAVVLALVHRRLNWAVMKKVSINTVRTVVAIHIIYVGIKIMSGGLSVSGVVGYVTEMLVSLPVPPLVILTMIFALFLMLGTVMEGIPMMLMMTPIVFPTVQALGYDALWFGIIIVLLCNTGNLTPPVGVTLFCLQALRPERPVTDIYKGVAPFMIVILVALALVTAFPQIALWLPGTMVGK